MAREPIGFYGTFRTPGVDTSAGKRLEALAGLAGGVADVAAGIGKNLAEDAAPARGLAKAQKAIETGGPLEKKSSFFYGADIENQVSFSAYKASVVDDYTQALNKLSAENSTDSVNFIKQAEAYKSGMSLDVPGELQASIDESFNLAKQTRYKTIYNAEIKIQNDKDVQAIQSGVDTMQTEMLIAMQNGDIDQVGIIAKQINTSVQPYLDAGLITPKEWADGTNAFTLELASAAVNGQINDLLTQPGKTPAENIQLAETAIANIKKEKRTQAFNPADPEKPITLSPDEKDKVVKELESTVKNFAENQLKIAEQNTSADKLRRAESFSVFQDDVFAADESDYESLEQKLSAARIKGNLTSEQVSSLKSYMTSSKAVNAITKAPVMNEIVSMMYDATVLDESTDENAQLEAVNEIKSVIMDRRILGDISAADEKKLLNQLTTLTSSKTAGQALKLLSDFSASNESMFASLPPGYHAEAARELFYLAMDAPEESKDVAWSSNAPTVIAKINAKRLKVRNEARIKMQNR